MGNNLKKLCGIALTVNLLTAITPTVDILVPQILAQEVDNQEARQSQDFTKVVVGDSLTPEQKDLALERFGINDISSKDYMILSGVELNQILDDGSNRSTPVYLSIVMESREPGYGVQVQNLSQNTLNELPSELIQNLLITAGAQDMLIKMYSPIPVSDTQLLASFSAIFDYFKIPLSEPGRKVANQELAMFSKMRDEEILTSDQFNHLMTQVKLAASEQSESLKNQEDTKALTSLIEEVVQSVRSEDQFEFTDQSIELVVGFAKEYLTLDLDKLNDQLTVSTADKLTMPQAIDFYHSVNQNSRFNTFGSEVEDDGEWELTDDKPDQTTLTYKETNTRYTFRKNRSLVELDIHTHDDEKNKDSLEYNLLIDKNTSLLLSILDHQRMEHTYEGGLDQDQALSYLRSVMYPDVEDLEIVYNKPTSKDIKENSYDFIIDHRNSRDNYRVDSNGQITLINNYYVSGRKIQFPNIKVEGGGVIYGQLEDKKVDELMNKFGKRAGKEFDKNTLENPGDMYGLIFPNNVLPKLAVDGEAVSAVWFSKAKTNPNAEVVVLAAYNNLQEGKNFDETVFYLFALVNGQPYVLESSQNQGSPDGLYHFASSKEQDLQKAFEKIMIKHSPNQTN